MGALLRPVLAHAQAAAPEPVAEIPGEPLVDPVAVPLLGLGRWDEVLHLHLLELADAEKEVAGRDLVAERLPDLRDAERRSSASELQHVLEVDEDPLRGLRSEVRARARLLHRPDRRLEHEVELARLRQVALLVLAGLLARLAAALRVLELVGAKAQLARAAVDERVAEALDVTGRLPHARMEDHCGIERDDVVALQDHGLEPARLDVVLQQDAVMAVVVRRAEPAVDLRGREDEAAPPAQRDDLLHRDGVHGHGPGRYYRTAAATDPAPTSTAPVIATTSSGETPPPPPDSVEADFEAFAPTRACNARVMSVCALE